MKIIATADIHGSQYRLNILLESIEKYKPDLVVICGDITQFGPKEVATNFLNQIPIETFAITGNIDTLEVEQGINESKAENIQLKRIERNKIPFVGFNGVDLSESSLKKIGELLNEESVLVTHVPPKGFQDRVFLGMHAGSPEIREIVDKYKPRLVLSGHIHENPGYTKNNDTIFVNCSMGKTGGGAIVDINREINVKMIE